MKNLIRRIILYLWEYYRISNAEKERMIALREDIKSFERIALLLDENIVFNETSV